MKYVLKTRAPSRPALDLDRDLNGQQRAVVDAPAGKLLVLAGAGSGKTRTLTYRVARLVASGCPPDRILLCTFTNRAAREMVGRVQELLGIDMRRCFAGTFHHVAHRILRRHAEAVGLSPDFGLIDPEDARTILSSVVAERGLKALTARRFPQPKMLHGLIGLAAGTRRPLEEIIAHRAAKVVDQLPAIVDVANEFERRKRRMNVCDFDDLLVYWLRLVADGRDSTGGNDATVRDEVLGRFDHVLVDEYQDINALQGSICDAMIGRCGSLTCVGDDAQSIYSFRGADFEQIHGFTHRHPDAHVLRLTVNYRSTPQILDLANRSIARNQQQHPKELQAVRPAGPRPAVIPVRDVFQQAEFVAQRILEIHHEQNLPLAKMAVLYRNHSHSLELQVELARRQIPFSVRSGVRFFEQAHIKDVVSYLRARENSQDVLAWMRLLRLWPGIGMQTAEHLATALAEPAADGSRAAVIDTLRAHLDTASARVRLALERLVQLWSILTDAEHENPGQAIRAVVTSHYADYAERSFHNADARREDLEHLAGYAAHYHDARDFLAEVALVEGISAESVTASEPSDDQLVLSTIHQAKGLEWPACFVLWLAEGKFPMPQSLRTPWELEEERRLFYVAATRAADELYLLYPTLEEGRDGPSHLLRPSRFLSEVDSSPPVFERWEISEEPADELP